MEATASVSPLNDCLTCSAACYISSVDDLTPWAVGKYAIITGVHTGSMELSNFITCRLTHCRVKCKRIYVCTEDVAECVEHRHAHTLIPLPHAKGKVYMERESDGWILLCILKRQTFSMACSLSCFTGTTPIATQQHFFQGQLSENQFVSVTQIFLVQ